MAYIGRDPQYGAFEKQALTADGSTTTFTLDYTVGSASSLLVSVAGVHQEPETAYNLGSNGTTIVFSSAPASGDTVFVIFLGAALEVATVGSGVITSRTELSAAAAADDLVLIYDTSATSLKKIQRSNLSDLLVDTTPQLGGNLDVNGNDIVSTSNAHIDIIPNGTGNVNLGTDTVQIGDNNANATLTTQGTGDLILNTNNGTNAGNITLEDGANGHIQVTTNGTGYIKFNDLAYIPQQALTSSSNAVAWDVQAKPNAYHLTTENTTFAAPTNSVEGSFISLEINYDGAHTIAFNTVFEFAASTAPTFTSTDGKTDILVFRYNGAIWQEVGRTLNLSES
jgi:hypothetical protein